MLKNKFNFIEQLIYSIGSLLIVLSARKHLNPVESDRLIFIIYWGFLWITINSSFVFSSIFLFPKSEDGKVKVSVELSQLLIAFCFIVTFLLCSRDYILLMPLVGMGFYDYIRRYSILLLSESFWLSAAIIFIFRISSFFFSSNLMSVIVLCFLPCLLISLIKLFRRFNLPDRDHFNIEFIKVYFNKSFAGGCSGMVDYVIQYAPGFILFHFGPTGDVTYFALVKSILSPISFFYQFIDTVVYRKVFLSNFDLKIKIRIGKISSYAKFFPKVIFFILSFVLISVGFAMVPKLFPPEFNFMALVFMAGFYLLYPFVRLKLLVIRKFKGVFSELALNGLFFIIYAVIIALSLIFMGVTVTAVAFATFISYILFTYITFKYNSKAHNA